MANARNVRRVDNRRAERENLGVHVPAAELHAVDVETDEGIESKAGLVGLAPGRVPIAQSLDEDFTGDRLERHHVDR